MTTTHGPRALASLALILQLSACGGGGGSSPPPPSPSPPPLIVAQSFSATEDSDFTGTIATRANAGAIVSVTVNPTRGTLTAFAGSGTFTYRPNADANGADTFTVEALDSANNRLTAVMTVNVASVNDAPVASHDFLEVASAASVTLTVRANDADVDGETPTVVLTTPAAGQEANPAIGTASVTANGEIELALPANFRGVTRVRYRLRDAAGLESAEATAVAFVGTPRFTLWYVAGDPGLSTTKLLVSDLVEVREPVTFIAPANFRGAKMSASGNVVVFAEGETTTRSLWMVGTAGTQTPVRLTPDFPAGSGINKWEVSPDGAWVAYELLSAGPPDLWMVPVANPAARVSVPRRPGVLSIEFTLPMKFSANSGGFYFVTLNEDLSRSLVRAPVANPSQPMLLYPLENETGNFFEYYVAPDESYVVTRDGNLNRVNVANPSDRVILNAPIAPLSVMNASLGDATATRFVYQTTDYDKAQAWADDELWMVDVATPGVSTRVLAADAARTGPLGLLALSPDRNQLLFNPWIAVTDGYELELAELSLSPADETPRLVSPAASGPPRMSTHGVYLDDDHILWVMLRNMEPTRLFESRRDAMGNPVEVTEPGILSLNPEISAGQAVLAFLHSRNSTADPLTYGVLVNRSAPGVMLRVTPGMPYTDFAGMLGMAEQP